MPRFEFNSKVALANKPPPLITNLLIVAELGATPKLASPEIDKIPAKMVVDPV